MAVNVKIYLYDLKQKNTIILKNKFKKSEFEFLGEPNLKAFKIELKANYVPENLVMVEGFIFADILKPCDKCLEEFVCALKIPFCKEYFIEDLDEKTEIDLTEDLREEFWLNYPNVFYCSDNCKGLCQGCGVNLNYEKCKCKKNNITENNPFGVLKKLKTEKYKR